MNGNTERLHATVVPSGYTASRFLPWGTCLTCEENWAGCFAYRSGERPRELARYQPGRTRGDILNMGALYVAVFNDDGTGEWRALDIRDKAFRDAAAAAGVEFRDQAEVLVNARLAADVVGATKMDRPEWGAVHPQTNEVYSALTNNSSRGGPTNPVDAANARARSATVIITRDDGGVIGS